MAEENSMPKINPESESELEFPAQGQGTFICSNCCSTFDLEKRVAAFQLANKVSGGVRQISVMDAISTTFNIKVDQSLLSSSSMCLNLEVCLHCANFLAGLYKNYQEFLQRSATKSEVYELIKLSLQGEVQLTAEQINTIFARYIHLEAGPATASLEDVKPPVLEREVVSTTEPDNPNTRISERLRGKRGRPRNPYFTDEYVIPSPRTKHRKLNLTTGPSVLSQTLPNPAPLEEPTDLDRMKSTMIGDEIVKPNPRAIANQLTQAMLKKKVAYKPDGTTSKNFVVGPLRTVRTSLGKSNGSTLVKSRFTTNKLNSTMIKKKVAYKSDEQHNIVTPTQVANGIPNHQTPTVEFSPGIISKRPSRMSIGIPGRKNYSGTSPTAAVAVSNGRMGRGISKKIVPIGSGARKSANFINSPRLLNGSVNESSKIANRSAVEMAETPIKKIGRPRKLGKSPIQTPITNGKVSGNGVLNRRDGRGRPRKQLPQIETPPDSISEVERTFQGFNCLNCGIVDPKKEKMVIHLVEVHLLTSESANSECDQASENYLERQRREKLRMVGSSVQKNHSPATGSPRTSTVCRECNKKFKTTEALQTHKKKAHNHLKPFACTVAECEMTFALKHSLTQHMKTHTNHEAHSTHTPTSRPKSPKPKRSKQTVQISSASKVKSPVQNKRRQLKMEKLHSCNLCGQHYQTSYLLKQHKLRHFDERTFQCDMCPKAFNTKSNLRKHKVVHLSRTAGCAKCPVCRMLFPSKAFMASHLINTHKYKFPLPAEKNGKSSPAADTSDFPETPQPALENVNDINVVLAVKSKPPPPPVF